jgi:hypothetical protein
MRELGVGNYSEAWIFLLEQLADDREREVAFEDAVPDLADRFAVEIPEPPRAAGLSTSIVDIRLLTLFVALTT